jgi:hypothetical protein
MILCEYFFVDFYSRGNDEYLYAWATKVDQMGDQGWEVLECIQRPRNFGLWTVLLCRSSRNGPRRKLRNGISENRDD